jgi:FKBP-type peptidyl-prolyl cis-trans isomerase SlyD
MQTSNSAKRIGILVVLALLGVVTQAQEGPKVVVADGRTVGFEYTLTGADGTVLQSNIGGDALEYVQGGHQILPALEAALAGLAVGEEKTVMLAAADAYGEVDPGAFREVPIEQVPEDARQVGAELSAPGYDGPIRVSEVRDATVVLDFNHPLAGMDLTFKVKILSIT